MPNVIGAARLEDLFHRTSGLDLDKQDLRRLKDFLNQKLYDLLLMGQATASANGRDIIQPWDLPITKGLQQSLRKFKELDMELDLREVLEQLATMPRLDLDYGHETEERLLEIVGALTINLAKTFKILDPEMKHPQTLDWDKAFGIFNLLL
jgi:hypothetical protein